VSAGIQNRFWLNDHQQIGFQNFEYERRVRYPARLQDEYVAVYCLEGQLSVAEDGESRILHPGEVLIGNSQRWRSSEYASSGPARGLTLIVHPRVLLRSLNLPDDSRQPKLLPVFRDKRTAPQLRRFIEDVLDEMGSNGIGKAELLEAMARELLVRILRLWPQDATPPAQSPSRLLSRRHFVTALDFMQTHGKSDFSVEGMCEGLGLTPGEFSKLFRATTGGTPLQVYNRLLIAQAEETLREGVESIKDVSYRLGFQSPSHFTSLYRKIKGTSPSDARASR
jgi:AraC-like DNA-binding protein